MEDGSILTVLGRMKHYDISGPVHFASFKLLRHTHARRGKPGCHGTKSLTSMRNIILLLFSYISERLTRERRPDLWEKFLINEGLK